MSLQQIKDAAARLREERAINDRLKREQEEELKGVWRDFRNLLLAEGVLDTRTTLEITPDFHFRFDGYSGLTNQVPKYIILATIPGQHMRTQFVVTEPRLGFITITEGKRDDFIAVIRRIMSDDTQ